MSTPTNNLINRFQTKPKYAASNSLLMPNQSSFTAFYVMCTKDFKLVVVLQAASRVGCGASYFGHCCPILFAVGWIQANSFLLQRISKHHVLLNW
jgi:hypothetical protein